MGSHRLPWRRSGHRRCVSARRSCPCTPEALRCSPNRSRPWRRPRPDDSSLGSGHRRTSSSRAGTASPSTIRTNVCGTRSGSLKVALAGEKVTEDYDTFCGQGIPPRRDPGEQPMPSWLLRCGRGCCAWPGGRRMGRSSTGCRLKTRPGQRDRQRAGSAGKEIVARIFVFPTRRPGGSASRRPIRHGGVPQRAGVPGVS